MKKRTIALIASVAAAFVFGACSREPVTIDVADYLKYDIDGFSGEGELTYEIDYDALIEDNKALKDCTSSKVKKAIKGKWDKVSEIKNGDEINFEWDISDKKIEEEYNVRFEADDIEVVVKDLKEIPKLDPFDYVEVKFSGIAPNGNAEMTVNTADLPVEELEFSIREAHGLSNGDEVTISLRNKDAEKICKEKGYKLTETTKTYTVEGLEEYVMSVDDIDNETIDSLKDQAEDLFFAKTDWAEDEVVTDCSLYGYYFVHLKDGLKPDYIHDKANIIYLILQISVEHSSGTVRYFYYVSFEDLIKAQDGKVRADDLYKNTYPTGYCILDTLALDAFMDERGENHHYYVGFLKTSEIYMDVIRPYGDYYNIEKSFDEDGEGGFGEIGGADVNED